MPSWITQAVPVTLKAMAGSGLPRALGCCQCATTTVPGFASLPPAHWVPYSDVTCLVSG